MQLYAHTYVALEKTHTTKRFSVHLRDCLEAAKTTQIMDIEHNCVNNSLRCPKRPELHRNLSSPALVAISRYGKYEG